MIDMEQDFFADTPYGKLALKKMAPVPENFRLYEVGWVEKGGNPEKWENLMVRGAEFRRAKSGPRKGKLCIKVPDTDRTAFLRKEEFQDQKGRKEADTHDHH